MNPVLRVRDDTFNRLKAFAEPLEDTVDDALRKVLDLAETAAPLAHEPEVATPVRTSAVTQASVRRERTAHVLERAGVLVPGTELVLLVERLPRTTKRAVKLTDPKFRAVVGDRPRARKNVIWQADGERYSVSTLSEHLREEHGVSLPEGGLNGYLHWGLASDRSRSLWEIAEEIREQNERTAATGVRQGGSE